MRLKTFHFSTLTVHITVTGYETENLSLLNTVTVHITVTGYETENLSLLNTVTVHITVTGYETDNLSLLNTVTVHITVTGYETDNLSLLNTVTVHITVTGYETENRSLLVIHLTCTRKTLLNTAHCALLWMPIVTETGVGKYNTLPDTVHLVHGVHKPLLWSGWSAVLRYLAGCVIWRAAYLFLLPPLHGCVARGPPPVTG